MTTRQAKRLGNQIKKARRRASLTQEKLADLVRVSPKHIQRIETGHHLPSLPLLYKIAEKIAVQPGDLLPKSGRTG